MSDLEKLESFHKTLDVDQLSDDAFLVELTLASAEFDALAHYLKIPGVSMLQARARVLRHGALVTVEGRIEATLTRECVATLEPLTEDIDEPFTVTYTTAPAAGDLPEEMEADLDAPEPVEGGILDMQDVFFEQLVLAMAPHPRKEGAEAIPDPGAGATISPFSVLKDLKSD